MYVDSTALCFWANCYRFQLDANIANAVKVANTTISNVWSVPCDATLQVAFTFGNLTFQLDEKSLIRQENGQCFGTIEEWIMPSATEYLLGSGLISKLYL